MFTSSPRSRRLLPRPPCPGHCSVSPPTRTPAPTTSRYGGTRSHGWAVRQPRPSRSPSSVIIHEVLPISDLFQRARDEGRVVYTP
jgi:hypothetical protein